MLVWIIAGGVVLASYLIAFKVVRTFIHRVQEKVRAGEEMFRALAENSPRGIHLYNLDDEGRLIFSGYNPAADRILGIDHRPLIGKSLQEAFPQLASTEIPERYKAAAADGTTWTTEQADYADGTVRGAFELIAFQTKPDSMAVVFSDVTKRTRMVEDLEDQRAFTSALLESLPGIFYLYDYPSLRMTLWNRNHETALGFATEDLRGRHILDWHVSEAKDAVMEAVEKVMRHGADKIEAPLVAKDGSKIPYLLTGTRFEAKGKNYLMGVGIDISDRMAAEEQLRLLNADLENRVAERTRELSEANRTLEGVLIELKASQDRMILAEKMGALGRLVSGLAHELNTPLGAILSASAMGSESVNSLIDLFPLYRSFDEEEASAFSSLLESVSLAGFEGGGAEGRKRCRLYRSVLEKTAPDRASSLADQLVDMGYLGSDIDLAELATLERFPLIVDSAYRVACIIQSNLVVRTAAEKAAHFVQALKTYSRQKNDRAYTPTDVRLQLETILTILRNKIKGDVEVVRTYREVPPVPCHPDRLSQVWMNIVNNALQAMRYRGRLELVVEPVRGGAAVAVSVMDDGPGIPENIQAHIFDPFFTTKAEGEGTGLGLDICRRILDEIGATIEFVSNPGRTRFTVTLPTSHGAKA